MGIKTWLGRPQTRVAGGLALVAIAIAVALFGPESDACACADPAQGPGVATPAVPSSGQGPAAPTASASPGSLDPVQTTERTPEPPIPLTAPADFGPEVTLRILRVEEVDGVARGPGEIDGPAVRLTLQLTNESDAALSLEPMVVAVTSGARRNPALSLTGPGGRPFQGVLPAGESATGIYVYAVPEAQRRVLEVTVSATHAAPVVVFRGAVG